MLIEGPGFEPVPVGAGRKDSRSINYGIYLIDLCLLLREQGNNNFQNKKQLLSIYQTCFDTLMSSQVANVFYKV